MTKHLSKGSGWEIKIQESSAVCMWHVAFTDLIEKGLLECERKKWVGALDLAHHLRLKKEEVDSRKQAGRRYFL